MYQEFDSEGARVDVAGKTAGRPPTRDDFFSSQFQPLWPQGKPLKPAKKKRPSLSSPVYSEGCTSIVHQMILQVTEDERIVEDIEGFNVIRLDFQLEE